MSLNLDLQQSGTAQAGAPRTVAEAIGQIVWLLCQSSLHKELRLKVLEWSFMPAVVHEQFRIFRFGPTPGFDEADPASFQQTLGMSKEALEQLPLGVAIWAKLSKGAEAKLEAGQPLDMAEWNSGDRWWLIEMICPFATPENRLNEIMMADLINGPFKGQTFSLHRTDPRTGVRETVSFPGKFG